MIKQFIVCLVAFGLVSSRPDLAINQQSNPQGLCMPGSTDLIPHPTACQRYFNCSDTSPRYRSFFQPYENECRYPQLFDGRELKCKPFKEAYCGPPRIAATEGCDYLRNKCPVAHCRPCWVDYPSCFNQTDGIQAHPNRTWTPFFIECDTERTINVSYCGNHYPTGVQAIFSPIKGKCVSLWEIPRSTGFGLEPSCADRAPGKYRTDERPDVYYTCPGVEVSYCPPETIFNEANGQCQQLEE